MRWKAIKNIQVKLNLKERVRRMFTKPVEITGNDRVVDFINSVDAEKQKDDQMANFYNSDTYKRNLIDRECEKGKNACLKYVIGNCYKNAVPLSDEYKNACGDDLIAKAGDHLPENLMMYFKETIKKGNCSDCCKKVVEAVCKEVDQKYIDPRIDPKKYKPEELVFKMDPDMQKRMDVVAQDMNLDDVSGLINNSVKSTAESEIKRAREEKEKNKELEKELANDLNMTSEAAIDHELQKRGYRDSKVFQPTLMQGIMIGNAERAESLMQENYTYHALDDYGLVSDNNNAMYAAFVESVCEYTWFVLEETMLRKRPYTLREVNDMAQEYAMGRR